MNRFILLQVAIADYRQYFIEEIAKAMGSELTIVVGPEYFSPSIKTSIKTVPYTPIRNWFPFRRKLCVQIPGFSLGWKMLTCNTLIADGNPRVLSTWFLLAARAVLFRRTVLWMHAWPRAGRHAKSDRLRGVMRNMASGILLYTHTQQNELREVMPTKKMWVATNALYKKGGLPLAVAKDPKSFIYVGRLVADKKVLLLMKAFDLVAASNPEARLIMVGDGPQMKEVQAHADASPARDRIRICGHVSDVETLSRYYAESICSVSPGYVGLSITQSLFFGRPIVIADKEPHAPEIEAASKGENCEFFTADSPESLAFVLSEFFVNRAKWIALESAIREVAENRYSVDSMVLGTISAFKNE